MNVYPKIVPALRIEQPIGFYFVAVLPASYLLEVAFSDALSANLREGEEIYDLDGTQRLPQPKRLQPIADFINRADAAFPNTIILAANFRKENGLLVDDEPDIDPDDDESNDMRTIGLRWTVSEKADGCWELIIPSKEKLAAIIDGQHRLFAFAKAQPERLDMNLICSVFIDLPKPFQAQIFATINSTQKPVDKSLTYEQFGYNLNDEDEQFWSPDKLAVFLSRKLAVESQSPLKGRIEIAPKKDVTLLRLGEGKEWKVSTAVVVEGIMRLFTSNPKKDTTFLLAPPQKRRSEIAALRKDRSPLRDIYLSSGDIIIYTMILNFLTACDKVFWTNVAPESFITKTVGIQALFDVLRKVARSAYDRRKISVAYFVDLLEPARSVNFAADEFRNASGSGRAAIRRAIESALNI
ncbi:MAG: DNA phosphorothioation-associated DGQHR protein 1 [Nevskia sp.]|uniref:DNA phosphorothioation-associated DGQHR protein 1 n=1 Tax=Nevskia sp. TaxID=1929292 RepID=UPI004035F767